VTIMPVEIRELVIRATVDPGEVAGSCGTSPAQAAGAPSGGAEGRAQADLLAACVREVLRILEDKRER
jgi:hypothetical protein